jgi:hypothetical protein
LQEQEQALVQGGQLLQLKQQLDSLCEQFQDQQVENDQQLQQILAQGNTCLKSAQALGELEAILKQLKYELTVKGQGKNALPNEQLTELAGDLQQRLRVEEANLRQEYQKSLQQAVSSLLRGMEIMGDINRLRQIYQSTKECEEMLQKISGQSQANKRGVTDVGSYIQ